MNQNLIPRSVLFGNPDISQVSISPDGKHLSWLAPDEGFLNVWVAPLADLTKARVISRDRKRGIRSHFWTYDNRTVLYIQDENGNENWQIFSIDIETAQTRNLTPFPEVTAQIEKAAPERPYEMVVGLNRRDPQWHDLFTLNIRTGELTPLLENPGGYMGFFVDNKFQVRLAARYEADGSVVYEEVRADKTFAPFMRVAPEDTLTTSPVGFTRDDSHLYFRDSRGRNTAALTSYDFAKKSFATLASDDLADINEVQLHPQTRALQAAAATYDRKRWQFFDRAFESDYRFLSELEKGEVTFLSSSLDDGQWIVAFLEDDGPVRYYHYDRARQAARFLFTNRRALEGLPLVKMEPHLIPTRDGFKMVSYLSRPKTLRQAGPMVLYVHGGPWARDDWGFNPVHQLLANRGYAVLSVNYRGSTGFGKGFLNAGNKEWGRKMHDDLIDAVKWAIDQEIADPSKIAIMGGSYGGYATLAGLTLTPDTFVCGVDIVGVSSLITFQESIPPYWESMRQLLRDRVGDPEKPDERQMLIERSPLTHAGRIKKPLLIAQGAHDPRVKKSESDQIVAEMLRKKVPVVYALYPDEGHGFARPPNSLSFFGLAENFLATYLGGRAEPPGPDLRGSTLQILEGQAELPRAFSAALKSDGTLKVD